MKKMFIVSLAAVMLMSFTACSKNEEVKTPDITTPAVTTEELPE